MASFSTAPGRNAHLFRPPQSPASITTTPNQATATDYFSSAGSRKRSWADTNYTLGQTPGWIQCPTPGEGSYTSASASLYGRGDMMVNERYTLAGGFDTPGLLAGAAMEQNADMHDRRPTRGQRSYSGSADTTYTSRQQLSGPLARERNGAPRLPTSPNGEATSSWTGLAFNIVGKVFTFGTSVVKGFYAGHGKGYALHPSHSPLRGLPWSREPCSTPLPGAWQDDSTGEFLGDFEQDNPSSGLHAGVRPTNKRRQTDRESWVLVGTPDVEIETSPRRKGGASSVRPGLVARPTASRANSRRSLAPLPRRQSSYTTAAPTSFSTGSPTASVTSLSRRASVAPMRSPGSLTSHNSRHAPSRPTSSSAAAAAAATYGAGSGSGSGREGMGSGGYAYVSPEAEKILRRREKQDRRADAAMGEMGRKLAELIRQGQAALGTRVDVEEGGGEDGW
ncbi:hypothetical protein LTR53_004834 [Teratosphaeriaceae sp. CCFEE 6253]|nr:hypothetical protein LTR53_004834 [Teratosphaeriaceae sp. CCFEE 6253]